MSQFVIRSGFALLALAIAASASAQELTGTLKKIKDTGAITIGHRESSIPFSYLDDKQQPVGYAMDLCMKIVDAVKAELKMPNLKVNMQPVTSGNRIPQLQAGNIDLECGSTTNSVDRQKQVSFGPTYFVINVTAASGRQQPDRIAGMRLDSRCTSRYTSGRGRSARTSPSNGVRGPL